MELHEETDGQLSFAEDMKKADWYMKKYVELGGKAVNC